MHYPVFEISFLIHFTSQAQSFYFWCMSFHIYWFSLSLHFHHLSPIHSFTISLKPIVSTIPSTIHVDSFLQTNRLLLRTLDQTGLLCSSFLLFSFHYIFVFLVSVQQTKLSLSAFLAHLFIHSLIHLSINPCIQTYITLSVYRYDSMMVVKSAQHVLCRCPSDLVGCWVVWNIHR